MVSKRSVILLLVLILSVLLVAGCDKGEEAAQEQEITVSIELPDSRSFYMGMTPNPHEYTPEGMEEAYRILDEHTDIIVHHFDSGIPWPEALENEPYHAQVENDLQYRTAKLKEGQRVYLAIAPLDQDRSSLAGYWGEIPAMERTGEWEDKAFDDPEVIEAYLDFSRDLIDRFKPDYFNYGVEVNLPWEGLDDPDFQSFLAFAEGVYATLKNEYPEMPVFLSLLKMEAQNDQTRMEINRKLLEYSDLVAVSTYPFLVDLGHMEANPSFIPQDWFSSMAGLDPGKPFAVAETGYIAEDLYMVQDDVELKGTEEWQAEYVQFLLSECNGLNTEFVTWFVPRDYDRASEYIKSIGGFPEWVHLWRDCGLIDGDGDARESLLVWDAWLGLEKV
jgi:hypothetical protein